MDRQLLRDSIRRLAELTYSRSGGPGGQNVNKVNTRAQARVSVNVLEGLSEPERRHALRRLHARLIGGEYLCAQSSQERSQLMNAKLALQNLEDTLVLAAAIPKRRIATKPSAASRARRLNHKHAHGAIKKDRNTGSLGFDD